MPTSLPSPPPFLSCRSTLKGRPKKTYDCIVTGTMATPDRVANMSFLAPHQPFGASRPTPPSREPL